MFHIGPLYFRNDRIKNLDTKLKCIRIKKSMGWCDDVGNSRYYNRLISTNNDVHHKSAKSNKNFKLSSLTENRTINKKINGIRPELNSENAFKKSEVIVCFFNFKNWR